MRSFLLLLTVLLAGCVGPGKQASLVGIYSPTSKDGVAVELSAGGDTSLSWTAPGLDGPLWLAGGSWREERGREGERLVVISWGGPESITYLVSDHDGVLALTKKSGSLPTPFGDGIEYASGYRKEPNMRTTDNDVAVPRRV